MAKKKKKILLFGGTFNPIHNGHLIVARHVAEKMGMDKVVIIPNGIPPHKKKCVDPHHKYEMIKLAIANESLFDTTTYEIDKKTKAYTIETIRRYKECLGNEIDKPYWLIGPDNFDNLHTWHRIDDIVEECILVCGCSKELAECMIDIPALTEPMSQGMMDLLGIKHQPYVKGKKWKWRWRWMPPYNNYPFYQKMDVRFIEIPKLDIRATGIRKRVARGLPISFLVPDMVEKYIKANKLYSK